MVSNCANAACGKPLHYLREGRIYVFDISVGSSPAGQKRERCLEHYWLCGACAATLILAQDAEGFIRILPRPAAIRETEEPGPAVDSMLAS